MVHSLKRAGLAIALAAATALVGSQAYAQATRKPAAPAQKPAEPAPAQPENRVELKPAQDKWTKVCGKDEQAGKEICYTTRDFGTDPNAAPVLALAVYDIKGDENKVIRLLMPVGLMLEPGFRFGIDKGANLDGKFQICFPNGCFAEARVKQPTIAALKRGTLMNVYVKNQVNNEVHFVLPLQGFGEAFDGAPVDPKVLQAQQEELAKQQQALQKQLEERAAQERQRLEAQGGAAAPK
jgi:invasion protein IalB